MNYEHVKILFWDYVAWAKKNAPIRSGVRTSDLTNLPLMLRDVDLSWYQPLLGYANWFYYKLPNPYLCMQLTWPDKSGLFDTEVGFDDKFRTIQPNLSLKCDESA